MHVFTYGTLMIPEVMEAVAGHVPNSVPATARGYAAYRIRGSRTRARPIYCPIDMRAG